MRVALGADHAGVPLKDAVRKPSGITAGDVVHIELTLKPRR